MGIQRREPAFGLERASSVELAFGMSVGLKNTNVWLGNDVREAGTSRVRRQCGQRHRVGNVGPVLGILSHLIVWLSRFMRARNGRNSGEISGGKCGRIKAFARYVVAPRRN